MQYKPASEKVPVMAVPYTPVTNRLSPSEDPQIRHTRKILLIILGVCLALSVVSLITAIFGSELKNQDGNTRRGTQVGQALASILFYGFGLLVAHKYSETGLRVFAWLAVVGIVLIGIVIVLLLIVAIAGLIVATHADNNENKGVMVGATVVFFFATGIYVAAFILSIIIIKLAFKLARLIDANKNFIVQQI